MVAGVDWVRSWYWSWSYSRPPRHPLFALAGLSSCGPLRAILLAEYTDWALLAVVSLGTPTAAGVSGHYRLRCALIGAVAIGVLLMFDDPASGHSIDHHDANFDASPGADRTTGMLLLLGASVVGMLRQSVGKKLGAKLGGVKRMNAVSTLGAAVLAAGIAQIRHASLTPPASSQGLPHATASLAA